MLFPQGKGRTGASTLWISRSMKQAITSGLCRTQKEMLEEAKKRKAGADEESKADAHEGSGVGAGAGAGASGSESPSSLGEAGPVPMLRRQQSQDSALGEAEAKVKGLAAVAGRDAVTSDYEATDSSILGTMLLWVPPEGREGKRNKPGQWYEIEVLRSRRMLLVYQIKEVRHCQCKLAWHNDCKGFTPPGRAIRKAGACVHL